MAKSSPQTSWRSWNGSRKRATLSPWPAMASTMRALAADVAWHGTGTDVAMNSGQTTLVKGDFAASPPHATSLSTPSETCQNLLFAFVYNALGCRLRQACLPIHWVVVPADRGAGHESGSASVIFNACVYGAENDRSSENDENPTSPKPGPLNAPRRW